MTESSRPRLSGLTRRRWTGCSLIWLAVGILFYALYQTSRHSIMNEIRSQAMGVATAVAAGISTDDLAAVQTTSDMGSETFMRIQRLLDKVGNSNPDVRYIYTMRKDASPTARPSTYSYIVDRSAYDINADGEIDADEISEETGNTYDAADLPAMLNAWLAPSADLDTTPDPPYPDLMSGYAPIKDERGITRAIVGIDIVASTVRQKMFAIRAIHLVGYCVLSLLLTLVTQLYYSQRETLNHNLLLTQELSSRNDMLRAANQELAAHAQQYENDLRLAEHVQRGFLPSTFPHRDRIQFDKFYLACDVLGGDLFDVFGDEEDRVAVYMADVAGHGVSAALISGLLKMAVSSMQQTSDIAHGHLHADLLHPAEVLHTLNQMLVKELPEDEFITMIYGVLDLSTDKLVMSSAGHPPPIHYRADTGQAGFCEVPTGMALGLVENQAYPLVEAKLSQGDRIIFYTDGVAEALNSESLEFGEDRMLEVASEHGHRTPAELIQALRAAVDEHRGEREVSDDFSLLVAQIKE